ncbi:MAG TPA: hypothetical protein VEJ84_23995, partial [Acidimicrobiales bacterium]|nr:hypothetical protein [Acidimicrobiales bacterium]
DHYDDVDVSVAEGALHRGDNVIVTSNQSHIYRIVGSTSRSAGSKPSSPRQILYGWVGALVNRPFATYLRLSRRT